MLCAAKPLRDYESRRQTPRGHVRATAPAITSASRDIYEFRHILNNTGCLYEANELSSESKHTTLRQPLAKTVVVARATNQSRGTTSPAKRDAASGPTKGPSIHDVDCGVHAIFLRKGVGLEGRRE